LKQKHSGDVSFMQIKDHVFLVTGASSGIGMSTAVALAERGAKVALLARSKVALE
jgi:short-subunit dehydrogenase